MIILDTNVLSELMRPRPSGEVARWIDARPVSRLFTTTITEGEILYGLTLLPKGKRREALRAAFGEILAEEFAGRILPFDSDAARALADISATRRLMGRPLSQFDAQIAAIARSRGAAVATRNVADFRDCGIEVLSPWGEGSAG